MQVLTLEETQKAHGAYTHSPAADIIIDGLIAGSFMGMLAYSGYPGLKLSSSVFNGAVLGVAINAIYASQL